MDINKEMFRQKTEELAHQLSIVDIDERTVLLEKLTALSSIEHSYDQLCEQFWNLFTVTSSVEIEITDGAISENYLNLRKALSMGLVTVERPILISFPGLDLPASRSDIKSNGYLRNRSIARRFFELTNIRQTNRMVRFSKIGADEYTLELTSSLPDSSSGAGADAGRLSPFQFSYCHIDIGESIAYVDDPSIVCTVYDDKRVIYNGTVYSLSALARKLRNTSSELQGPRYFTYHGELLCDLRKRLESQV